MFRYFFKRILLMIPTFLAIMLVIFILMTVIPGSSGFSSNGGGDWLDMVFSSLGAESTYAAKYIRYVYNLIFKLDFGSTNEFYNLRRTIFYRLQFTLQLASLGFLLSILIGIPAGTVAAIYHGRSADKGISIATLVLNSIPSYALAVALVILFCLEFRLLPSFGFQSAEYYILPAIVTAAGGIALITRITRSAVLDVLDKQYVTVLRAMGLSESKIICCHIMKNAMSTIAASLNNLAVQLLCGTLIAENFFSIPGICQLLTKSISSRSQQAVMGCVAVISVLLMCVSILSDLLLAAVNPQVRMEFAGKGGRRHGA